MEPTSTCQQIQDQIDQMSQRQLRLAADQGPVRDHVQGCPACKGYLAKALDLASQLDRWEVPQPKRNIVAAVMAEIAEMEVDQRPARITLGEHLVSLLRIRVQVPAAAAVLVIGALIASIGMNVIRTHRPVTEQETSPVAVTIPVAAVQTTGPKVVPVQVQGTQPLKSLLANPALVPSTVIVILGMPPVMPEEITPRVIPTVNEKIL
jgi:hypothetical protein